MPSTNFYFDSIQDGDVKKQMTEEQIVAEEMDLLLNSIIELATPPSEVFGMLEKEFERIVERSYVSQERDKPIHLVRAESDLKYLQRRAKKLRYFAEQRAKLPTTYTYESLGQMEDGV